MITRRQKIRLGIFILLGFIALAAFAAMVAGPSLLQSWDYYEIVFEDASVRGVNQGGPVYYNGITIGTVLQMRFDPENYQRVIIEIAVNKDVKIREDTRAQLVLAGITGTTNIELRGGSLDAPVLEPGSTIKMAPGLLDQLLTPVLDLSNSADGFILDASNLINPDNPDSIAQTLANVNLLILQNAQQLNSITNNIDSLIKQSSEPLVQSLQNLSSITDRLNRSLDNIDHTVETLQQEIEKANLPRFADVSEELINAARQVDSAASQVEQLTIQSQGSFFAVMDSLRLTADNLSQFSFLLSEDPGLLLRSRRD
ncbi:MlaD family protein [Spirochaeta dissipatitropha]